MENKCKLEPRLRKAHGSYLLAVAGIKDQAEAALLVTVDKVGNPLESTSEVGDGL
jgi:hypothetical protein